MSTIDFNMNSNYNVYVSYTLPKDNLDWVNYLIMFNTFCKIKYTIKIDIVNKL